MNLRRSFSLALMTMLVSCNLSRADYAFLFTDSSGVASNTFTVAAGSTVDIRVYLTQTGTSAGLSAQGLNSAGVQLSNYNTAIATVSNVTANSSFDVNSTSTGANAKVTEFQTISSPVKAPTSGTDANRVLLGTFTFTGVSAGTTLTVTAIPSTGTSVNVIAPGGADSGSIDGSILNASAAITVTAIPEPGSMILAGIAVAGFGAGLLRRRFLRKQEQPGPAAS